MKKFIEEMIKNGILIGGKIINQDDFVIFKRLPYEELLQLDETERAYATKSMGRGIFTVTSDKKIKNIKGVDSHLDNSENISMQLSEADAVYICQSGENYLDSNYPINLVVYPGEKCDVRLRGTSPLEDLEIEGDINFRMQKLGIKLPNFSVIREFSSNFAKELGLPMKIDGSYYEFECDYRDIDAKRKIDLSQVYGSRYSTEELDGKRPEKLLEFFSRIGIAQHPEFIAFAKKYQVSVEDFAKKVDLSYSLGQRYGQAVRIVENPFRISDLEYYVEIKNLEAINSIIKFSEEIQGTQCLENDYAKQMGKNIALLMNSGWMCENFAHRQDYTLAGEMCDDAYFDLFEHNLDIEEKEKHPGKSRAGKIDNIRKYFLQVYHIASTIKVLQDEMILRGKTQEEIDSVLEDFSSSFAEFLNIEQIAENFNSTPENIKNIFKELLSTPLDYRKLLASQTRKNGIEYDEQILLSHKNNNSFFNAFSSTLAKELGIEQSFIQLTPNIEASIKTIEKAEKNIRLNIQLESLAAKYKNEDPELFQYIVDLVERKNKEGAWDKGIENGNENLTIVLLYEYSSSLEKITECNFRARDVLEKLESNMGRLRFGDYKTGNDDIVLYDKQPVTSNEYKEMCRMKYTFGAHAPTYSENGEEKVGLAIFDDTQTFVDENGEKHILSGIDLGNLTDIRGTIFHELTHVMEKSKIKVSELSEEDIIFRNGDSTYINTMVQDAWSIDEYEDYISQVPTFDEDTEVFFGGISTIEINKKKSPNRRIMHNQISEGATEYIARLVTQMVGDVVIDPTRYENKVSAVEKIFASIGTSDAITTYLTDSRKIIRDLESRKAPYGFDMLHYISEHVDFLGNLEHNVKEQIKLQGKDENLFEDIKKEFLIFWHTNPSATAQEKDAKVNEILSNLNLKFSMPVVGALMKGIRYPEMNDLYIKTLEKEFPKKKQATKTSFYQNPIEASEDAPDLV